MKPDDMVCDGCPGERKRQKIVSMNVIANMVKKGDVYEGGQVLDPPPLLTLYSRLRFALTLVSRKNNWRCSSVLIPANACVRVSSAIDCRTSNTGAAASVR